MEQDIRLRQAVVVIHGIGEQRPMATLRSFTRGVVPPDAGDPPYSSHPDRYSASQEHFALRAPPRSAGPEIPITDFFECHWAHRMRDTRLGTVWSWIARLVVTVPRRDATIYPVHRAALVLLPVCAAVVVAAYFAAQEVFDGSRTTAVLASGALSFLFGGLLQRYVGGYVGDAARYLTPNPENLVERAAIRNQARTLLNRLHRQRKYQRIIVVGHSLGSVIAYDVVARLWDEYRFRQMRGTASQTALKEIETLAAKLRVEGAALNEARAALASAPRRGQAARREEVARCEAAVSLTRAAFRTAQTALWEEQKELGNPWLITDLITLGSPLAHMDYLLRAAGDRDETLSARKKTREFPHCPPLKDDWEREPDQRPPDTDIPAIAYRPRGWKSRVIVPSAVFGFVRWTNLYYGGDVIAGPLGPEFGYGIEDQQVFHNGARTARGDRIGRLPISHTRYWSRPQAGVGGHPTAVEALQSALALDDAEVRGRLEREALRQANAQRRVKADRHATAKRRASARRRAKRRPAAGVT